jgi:hypothetical protein
VWWIDGKGKFQLVLMPQCGHVMQEDAPEHVADAIWSFWKRNSKSNLPPVLLKKLLNRSQS